MNQFMRRSISIMSAILFVSGCASMGDLTDEVIKARASGKEGVSRVYPVTENQAWVLTEAVLRWEKTDEVEVHNKERFVISSTGMKMVTFGSVIGVWIDPVDSEHTMLTVVTRRRVNFDRFTRLTASSFHERFDQGVRIIKAGQQLPAIPPEDTEHQ